MRIWLVARAQHPASEDVEKISATIADRLEARLTKIQGPGMGSAPAGGRLQLNRVEAAKRLGCKHRGTNRPRTHLSPRACSLRPADRHHAGRHRFGVRRWRLCDAVCRETTTGRIAPREDPAAPPKVRVICDLTQAPEGRTDCEDCERPDRLVAALRKG